MNVMPPMFVSKAINYDFPFPPPSLSPFNLHLTKGHIQEHGHNWRTSTNLQSAKCRSSSKTAQDRTQRKKFSLHQHHHLLRHYNFKCECSGHLLFHALSSAATFRFFTFIFIFFKSLIESTCHLMLGLPNILLPIELPSPRWSCGQHV